MQVTPNYKDPRFLEAFKDMSLTFIGSLDILVKNNYLNDTEIKELKSKVASAFLRKSQHDDHGDKHRHRQLVQSGPYQGCAASGIPNKVATCTDVQVANYYSDCGSYYEAPVCLVYESSGACSVYGGIECTYNNNDYPVQGCVASNFGCATTIT